MDGNAVNLAMCDAITVERQPVAKSKLLAWRGTSATTIAAGEHKDIRESADKLIAILETISDAYLGKNMP
jgi:hypothetical protein